MNKYMIKEGIRGMYFLGENNKMDVIDYTSTRINYMYVADEDGELTYIKRDGSKQELNVKAGDLIVEFYSGYDFPNQCIVLQSETWKNNLDAYKQACLKRAEANKEAKSEAPYKECDLAQCPCMPA